MGVNVYPGSLINVLKSFNELKIGSKGLLPSIDVVTIHFDLQFFLKIVIFFMIWNKLQNLNSFNYKVKNLSETYFENIKFC